MLLSVTQNTTFLLLVLFFTADMSIHLHLDASVSLRILLAVVEILICTHTDGPPVCSSGAQAGGGGRARSGEGNRFPFRYSSGTSAYRWR